MLTRRGHRLQPISCRLDAQKGVGGGVMREKRFPSSARLFQTLDDDNPIDFSGHDPDTVPSCELQFLLLALSETPEGGSQSRRVCI